MTTCVNYNELSSSRVATILRRLNDFQIYYPQDPLRNAIEIRLHLDELVGIPPTCRKTRNPERNLDILIEDLCRQVNLNDMFVDFREMRSITKLLLGGQNGDRVPLWNLLQQTILSWEFALRLPHVSSHLFLREHSERILASLIISDRWLKHVWISLREEKISTHGAKTPETAERKAKAKTFKEIGNEARKRGEYQKAVDMYTEAVNIDPANAAYRCDRSAALIMMNHVDEAEADASIATRLGPMNAEAWSRLGMAALKQGHGKRAKQAYETALKMAGNDASSAMRKGLADAEATIEEAVTAIRSEPDPVKAHFLRSACLNEDWHPTGKEIAARSLVHQQQAEGLLLFAERIKWPFIQETRDTAESAYGRFLGGTAIDWHLNDWLHGLTLPGKWCAWKIMSALIVCTPSICKDLGLGPTFECGLSLPTRSYWRARTVLGRVLGCLPDVTSICGWIGPCPPVRFEPPLPAKPRHVGIKTRGVSPVEPPRDHLDAAPRPAVSRPAPVRIMQEEMDSFFAEGVDPFRRIGLKPPEHDTSVYSIESIRLATLPGQAQAEIGRRAASAAAHDVDAERLAEGRAGFRASIVFRRDDNAANPVAYTLYTNPVFAHLPPCFFGHAGHRIPAQDLEQYQNVWPVDKLQEHTVEADLGQNDGEARVMVINATGKGAEVAARAWCAERGRNAAIRRAGGPCFACSVRAASKSGLRLGVLIWTD
ncbi:hypothetical protein VTJ83DRAFT_4748 [Remersonia thermophila]|uniref:Uncharacterized protein n=1 Tax=Remersonia thermophila TaxID=72144 RepID=A0ABR4DCA4_9PEZI